MATSKKSLVFFFFVLIVFIVFNYAFPFKPKIEYSPIILAEDKTLLNAFLTSDEKWRMYTTLDEITPALKKAIVYKEDKYFYSHLGINPISIGRAAWNNIFEGRRTSGASTITMQVARMLEPKERSYSNKIIEVFRALQLEWNYSKAEILQLYLNLVPYGGNIEGVKSASLLYFEKMPNHLSLAEVTTLSIIPNRPNSLRIGRKNTFIEQERNKWLDRFEVDNVFQKEAIEDALSEPLNARRIVLPKHVPHLSLRLKNEQSNQAIIETTIDLNTQLTAASIIRNYVNQLKSISIKNAAVLIVENETMQVKAYVGSSDYFSSEDAGQVDGIRAIRSPGSTLKPLLYGLAIDKGIITPKSIISDVKVNFRGYQPRNYKEEFNGNVTIEYALANSLNIPAVKILNQIKPYHFIKVLSASGFQQIERDKEFLGLSTVLGGCGASLEELTNLYLSFAHDGYLTKLNFLKSDSTTSKASVLSSEANYMITEILTNVTRPDLPAQWKNASNLPKVAWKTGTSYGRRDAWSIGFNKKYTIGVWVGNFSGEGVQELTGAEIAAPLLFNIFNAVDQTSGKEWFKMPKGVNFRHVCTESGLPPNSFCGSQKLDYFIPGISPYQKCSHLNYINVSLDSTKSYCSTCLPENGYVKALYPNHTPEIIAYLESEKLNYTRLPLHNEECERVFTTSAPKIISPVDKLEYFVDKTDSLQIMLSCQTANNVSEVFWYINDQFFRSSLANENIYFTPEDGNVKISCTDDKGRNTDIEIRVKKVRF